MARLEQLLLALVFLTRLPLGRFMPSRILPLRASAWAFPLAGAMIGAIAALPLLVEGPPLLLAGLSLALSVGLTGALHEDGLADLADAAGGADRASRLDIMRDSRIGSYGVMALLLTTLLRLAALTVIGPVQLIAAAIAGRTAIVLVLASLPPARPDGLGRMAEAPGPWQIVIAVMIALAALALGGGVGIVALASGLVVLALLIARARSWLGGYTGDVLGAASVLVETAVLVTFALQAAG